jgi:hypothetical protein
MMKKITFLLAALVFTFAVADAQKLLRSGDVQTKTQKAITEKGFLAEEIFAEDFEDYNGDDVTLASEGWMIYDEDGDDYNWFVASTTTLSQVVVSESSYQDDNDDWQALTPENWLVSPAIDLSSYTETIVLDWRAFAFSTDFPAENYKVVVSTTGNTVADFSTDDIVFEETLGTDIYERRVDLSAYAGEEIYLAFVHYDCTDMYILGIDNIAVGTPATTYTTTFNVDMTDVETDVFDPTVDKLYVTGSMVDWAEPGLYGSLELTDIGSSTYSATIELPDGDYEYKYFVVKDGQTEPGWENGEWEGGADRTFTVAGAEQTLNDVWGDNPNSVEEVAFEADINVYPNPSTGLFNITTTESVKLEVFDISGRTVKSQIIDGNTQVQLRNAGMYFFRFSNENGSTVNKVIVK